MNVYFLFVSFSFLFYSEAWRTIYRKGFFGFLGIDGIKKTQKQSIYEAFTQNGVLQGVFIDTDAEGKQIVNPIQQKMQTQRVQQGIPSFDANLGTTIITSFIQHITNNRWNFFGSANTALMQDMQNKTYALFERDLPYEVVLDFQHHHAFSGNRTWIPGIHTFSGHSKKRDEKEVIDTIEYNVFSRQVIHNVLQGDLKKILHQTVYPSHYIPVVHDFFISDSIPLCWIDSPFQFCLRKESPRGYNFPIGLKKDLPTFFHVGNETFSYEKGVAVFHIAYVSETKESYNIYASIYESLHFSEDIKNISAIYGCIRLDRKTRSVRIFKNRDLTPYNLDFPVLWGGDKSKKVILRNIDYKTKRINGFIICDRLHIVKKLFFADPFEGSNKNLYLSGLGEPVVVTDRGIPYLLFFVEENGEPDGYNVTYLMKWNLNDGELDSFPLNISFHMGFHSIWIDKTS